MNIHVPGGLQTVGEIIGDGPAYDGPTPLVIPSATHIAEPLPNGIYFGLDEDAYHAQPSFSTSGIKNLNASTMDFWARSFMNAEKEAEDKTSAPMTLGKAYHKRILEGSAAFYARYAPAISRADHPNALDTADDMKVWLMENGCAFKKSGSKTELRDTILAIDPTVEIWAKLQADHAAEFEGFELIDPDRIKRIEIAAAMIERHPDLSRIFRDGYSEVSVFWTCAKTGVPMKARFDYLKLSMIGDLKTISNVNMIPFDTCCANAVAGRGYYIQAAVYQEAIAAAKAMYLNAYDAGAGALPVYGDHDADWMHKLARSPAPSFAFVFQQTGIAPVARGFRFKSTLLSYSIGEGLALEAKRKFRDCLENFGTAWWIDEQGIRDFDDGEFPAWIGR